MTHFLRQAFDLLNIGLLFIFQRSVWLHLKHSNFFFSMKRFFIKGQTQDEAIVSSCSMLATAL